MSELNDADIPPELAERLAQLSKSFVEGLPERFERLQSAFDSLKPGTFEQAKTAMEAVRFETHKLAGSGSTFGFPDISDLAGQIEVDIRLLMDDGRGPDAASFDDLHDLRRGLENAINRAIENVSDFNDIKSLDGDTSNKVTTKEASVIAIVGKADFAAFIESELQAFGYKTRAMTSVDQACVASKKREITLAIIDGDMDDNGPTGAAKKVETAREHGELSCPVVFATETNDVATRLSIVRAGAESFISKPIEPARLIDVVDGLGRPGDAEPYRVLVIDDDIGVAEFVSAVLREAGMIVETMTDPSGILDSMDSFAPELVLIDLYMPNCTGPEIASVIRQEDTFAGVPIVFLSGEKDRSKQLTAIGVGGDDFITKPIMPPYLIKAVRSRAKRFRTINAKMVRDSLTGLLNHSTTMQFMSVEVQRAERNGSPVSVAIADIDHFKSVNDTYGHAVGDRVIKSLARTLTVRLRGTDIIGRTGGEEFTVIMPDTPIEQAEIVLNEIREEFADIVHRSEIENFSKSLSIGVTAAPPYVEAHSLHERADVALYKAKRRGRNNVCVWE